MLLTRLFAYLEAKSAAGLLSVSDFIEAKLKQFTKRVITKHHEIVVKDDGTTDIVSLDKGSDEEALDYAIRDQDVAGKHAKLDTELASLDQRIREEEDKLSEIKEKREASGITNEPPGPIKSELRKSFICLLFFLLVEIATLTIFFQDVFAGNLILLLVLASGTCGGTYLLGFWIMRFGEQRKIIPCVALSLLLVIWGVSLGYFRALMLASGAANWSLTILFIFLTIGLPLVQALFGHRHSNALERLNNSLEEQRKLQPQERKVQSELRELKRLREDALERRNRLGKQVLVAEEKKVNRNNSEHVFLKTIEAKLTIYRQAYLHWQRKKPSPSFPIKSIQPRLNEKSIKSKEAQEWPKLRALPY